MGGIKKAFVVFWFFWGLISFTTCFQTRESYIIVLNNAKDKQEKNYEGRTVSCSIY
jgi:hypothetical protein